MFSAPDVFRHYRLPFPFQEFVVVTERFHVKPLLPLLSGDGQFYLLALSQNGVRVLQGTHGQGLLYTGGELPRLTSTHPQAVRCHAGGAHSSSLSALCTPRRPAILSIVLPLWSPSGRIPSDVRTTSPLHH
jgi:hypothetical protein